MASEQRLASSPHSDSKIGIAEGLWYAVKRKDQKGSATSVCTCLYAIYSTH